jgi:hypothetical protein
MILAITLMWLAATPGAGSAAAPPGETVALIWGGGKDAAATKASLERWESEKKLLGDVLVFAPGFPKVVSSDTVPGLKPGFEVVLLGVCGRDEARPARSYLKALYPFTYERLVREQALACPTWKMLPEQEDPEDPFERTVDRPKTVKFPGGTLSVVVLSVPGIDPEARVQQDVPVRWLSVVARDDAGTLLNAYSLVDERAYIAGPRNIGCTTSVKSVRKGAVVFERDCNGTSGACQADPGEKKRVTVHWDGKDFRAEEKVLKRWAGTGCAE